VATMSKSANGANPLRVYRGEACKLRAVLYMEPKDGGCTPNRVVRMAFMQAIATQFHG
jgi:hypothetical protein